MADLNFLVGIFVESWRRDLVRNLHEMKLPAVLPDSVKVSCSQCRVLIWLGPRQHENYQKGKGQPLCLNCLVSLASENGQLDFVHLGNPASHFET